MSVLGLVTNICGKITSNITLKVSSQPPCLTLHWGFITNQKRKIKINNKFFLL